MSNNEHSTTPATKLFLTTLGLPRELAIEFAYQAGCEQRGAVNEAELQQARDEELEACCEWVATYISTPESAELRAARRPQQVSLKEQALEVLEKWAEDEYGPGAVFHKGLEVGLIRRALEALPE